MTARYSEPADGEWVQPIPRGYKLRCCDCALVHRMDFRIAKGRRSGRKIERVQFRAVRDERATAASRRALKIKRP